MDELEKWIAKNNLKKTRNHKAGSYNVAADINGNINVNLTFKPEALATVLDIAATLYHAANQSINMINRRRNDNINIEKERQKSIATTKEEKRIALSIYRRTDSKKLATSRFKWMDCTSIRMLVNNADVQQKKRYLSARNMHMLRLYSKHGHSIRKIAKRYKLHPSTVHSIIKREAKKIHPALF